MRVTDFLREDHKKVADLFLQVEANPSLADKIVADLEKHDKIELDIVYPAVSVEIPDLQDELGHALGEHDEIRSLIGKVRNAQAAKDDEELMAQLHELRTAVEHHVDEEESKILPQMDLRIMESKLERLTERINLPYEDEPTTGAPS